MTKQHPVSRCQGQCVTSTFFPGQVLGARHQLLGLSAGELSKRTVRRFIAPDALAVGIHRVAAVALLVVTVVLVTVNDDFVTHFPALNLVPDRPDNA